MGSGDAIQHNCWPSRVHDIVSPNPRAPLHQLLSWWKNVALVPGEWTREQAIDEVAYALTTHDDGVEKLKLYLDSDDVSKRKAALYFLAWPGIADADIEAALVRAFASSNDSLKYTALWGFIHLDHFPIPRNEVTRLLHADNERLAALSMVYLSRAYPDEAVRLLRGGLRSTNRYKRSYACDEIGDREINELVKDMQVLLDDKEADVAQAAKSNLGCFA